tara:strand:- start:32387 stop:33004 length:618 start_codon:yes stop_codon:yes gene_type:complete
MQTGRRTDGEQHISTERVWGAAYHIPAEYVAEVRNYLDIREINGYSIQFTPFHPAPSTTSTATSEPPASNPPSSTDIPTTDDAAGLTRPHPASVPPSPSAPLRCLVYIGLPSNPQFLGPQEPEALARRILASRGPSGENREYLYNLESALAGLGGESGDRHVSDLVERCRAIEARDGRVEKGKGEMEGEGLHRVGSTEEVEEVEK